SLCCCVSADTNNLETNLWAGAFSFTSLLSVSLTLSLYNVTLRCFYTSSASHLNWYKQVPGESLQIISTFYKHHAGSDTFHKQFKDNRRFSVHTEEGLYDLKISDVRDSDSALYYCGYTSISITKFDNGTFLLSFVHSFSPLTFLHQPDSVSAQPGGSVTLNCTMLTGTVNGDHNVYWFRKNSEGSGLGTLFTTTRSGGPCARSSEDGPDVLRCVYSLPRRNVTVSDAGTYHCAVASCGRILFGPGTRLYVGGQFEVLVQLKPRRSSVLTGCLCGCSLFLLSITHLGHRFLSRPVI
uniref:Immunoglobulin kappa light chain-like n=1 Tax=Xiphophorus maculatus TaxID=8083 RepID=A0A3B5QUY9_XIPMA